ncbi:MAG: hypothetical protein DRG20_00925 [Deltaproteobacteria bacterium]|nr:MAG: hypothetical protein DRG20_00925 [Deltaproteobacteria bacterium]
MEIKDQRKNWKEAFNCKKCARGERTDCPCYLEYFEINQKTGEQRLVKTCLFRLLPRLLIENTKSADGLHSALNSLRNTVFDRITRAIELKEKELKQLEAKDALGNSRSK